MIQPNTIFFFAPYTTYTNMIHIHITHYTRLNAIPSMIIVQAIPTILEMNLYRIEKPSTLSLYWYRNNFFLLIFIHVYIAIHSFVSIIAQYLPPYIYRCKYRGIRPYVCLHILSIAFILGWLGELVTLMQESKERSWQGKEAREVKGLRRVYVKWCDYLRIFRIV